MLNKVLYALPEISLFIGIINLLFLHLLSNDIPKMYGKTARIWLLIYLFFTILFYDKSFNSTYFENTSYTLLFKCLIAFFTYIMLIMSSTWFTSENKTGCRYLILVFSSIIVANLLLASVNIIILLSGYALLIYINYRLLDISYDKYPSEIAPRYIGTSSVIIILMFLGFGYIFFYNNITDYTDIKQLISVSHNNFTLYLAIVFIIIPFLYSLGLAPFHLLAEDKVSKSILPVSHYFSIVTPLIFWGALIKINIIFMYPYKEILSFAYGAIAIISIVFGAIGANARINLHRIYAYGSMYHFGVVILLLSYFNSLSDFGAFIYLFLYLIAINGIYAVFYNLKSHGDFFSSLTSLSGISQTKPYTTRAMLISIFSLIGFPPFAGFLAEFGMINELLKEKSYIYLTVVLFFFLVLAKSYLEIIKTAYFEQKMKKYDTENKLILIITFLSTLLIVAISFNPFNIIEKIKDMFDVIYL